MLYIIDSEKNAGSAEAGLEGFFARIAADPNNMSHWLPKLLQVLDGERQLKIPKTLILRVPEDVAKAFFHDRIDDSDRITAWVKKQMPVIQDFGQYPLFIKTGTFSDKFNFKNNIAIPELPELAGKIQNIFYNALCCGANGTTELVLREVIPHNHETTPCIYGGLPLRPEFRVFYDFDRHAALYATNYWDWETCAAAIGRDATDRIVYATQYGTLKYEYERLVDAVKAKVENDLCGVKGLAGVWSVDVLYEKELEQNPFWLIDMAVGVRSAYWDEDKIKYTQAALDAAH